MSKIKINDLNPDTTYLLRGKVAYSRVSRHTTDEERIKDNQRRTYKIDKNYTNITIYDVQILCKDPTNPTIEEQYAAECLYKSHVDKYTGKSFSALNKSENLPKVGVIDEKTGEYNVVKLQGELAQGLDVTIVMRVFKGKNSMNNGVSLDTILVNEPLRYFSNNVVEKDLEARGIIFHDEAPMEAPAGDKPVEDPQAEPQADANPFAANTQAPEPAKAEEKPATNNADDDNPFVSIGNKRQY
jgi:hypothetical protein